MSEKVHAPLLSSISANPCWCGGKKSFGKYQCESCDKNEKINLGKPWDENSFGVLAEKVFCDGCGEEIDPRSTEDLCFSCKEEAKQYDEK